MILGYPYFWKHPYVCIYIHIYIYIYIYVSNSYHQDIYPLQKHQPSSPLQPTDAVFFQDATYAAFKSFVSQLIADASKEVGESKRNEFQEVGLETWGRWFYHMVDVVNECKWAVWCLYIVGEVWWRDVFWGSVLVEDFELKSFWSIVFVELVVNFCFLGRFDISQFDEHTCSIRLKPPPLRIEACRCYNHDDSMIHPDICHDGSELLVDKEAMTRFCDSQSILYHIFLMTKIGYITYYISGALRLCSRRKASIYHVFLILCIHSTWLAKIIFRSFIVVYVSQWFYIMPAPSGIMFRIRGSRSEPHHFSTSKSLVFHTLLLPLCKVGREPIVINGDVGSF